MSMPAPPDVPPYNGPKTDGHSVDVLWPLAGLELQIVDRQTRSFPEGRLVDFAVSLEGRPEDSDEGWANLARVDCATGFVHVDDPGHHHDASPVPANCRTDLEAAHRWALGYCWDEY